MARIHPNDRNFLGEVNQFNSTLGNGGKTSLQTLLSLPDPQLSFKWRCKYLPFSFPVHYVESVDLPFNNVEVGDTTHVGASYIQYPGPHKISTTSLVFYEDRYCSSLKFLTGWKQKIKNFNTGIYNLPGEYKQTIVVELMDNANNPVVTVTLLGCWPTDTGNLSLNYTDAGRVTISQVFSIDNQELFFHW